MEKDNLSEKESLALISQMIQKAKNSYHDSGTGPILWGTVITICSLVTYAQITYGFKLPFDIWLLTLVAIVPQIFIVSREKKRSKVRPYDQTVMDYVWLCFGISIFLLVFINNNICSKLAPVFKTYIEVKGTRPEFNYSSFSTSFFLLLYGIPTIITGGCRKLRPMLYGGILCWICCIISVYTKSDVDMLLTAIAATAAWLVPGLIIRHRNKKRAAADV
ncbi:MAG TPA: hypothetical protein PKC39_00755 [Ferruginibacter sp.]|nr:hypothetical protein [Ferruginibacter sp.]HMP19461.1 hypothetical protein [Ferruginibacter sp.]